MNTFYTPEHLYISENEGTVIIGISAHLLKKAGQVCFINLPDEGDELHAGVIMGSIEGSKGVFDLVCPADCVIESVNDGRLVEPAGLGADEFLIKARLTAPVAHLLLPEEYSVLCSADNSLVPPRNREL